MILQQRKAFSMVTSVFVIVIMASVAMLVMNVTSNTIKETTQQYRKEQAVLLAKSYTEFAIMAVTANDRSIGCIKNIVGEDIIGEDSDGKGYQVEGRIYYIGNNTTANLASCSTGSNSTLDSNVQTDGSDLQIIVDVYVKYRDIDRVDNSISNNKDWITYHRRTLQKI